MPAIKFDSSHQSGFFKTSQTFDIHEKQVSLKYLWMLQCPYGLATINQN